MRTIGNWIAQGGLVLVFAQYCVATPISVSAVASAFFSLSVDCNDQHSAQGSATASAAASCVGAGNHSEASAAATFQSVASNLLAINGSSTDTTGGNIYTDSVVAWHIPLVAQGWTGNAYLMPRLSATGTFVGSGPEITCEIVGGVSNPCLQGNFFGPGLSLASGTSFYWDLQLHVRTIADIFDSVPPGENPPAVRVVSVNYSLSLTSFEVWDAQGFPIQGATVQVIPEPSVGALTAGGLMVFAFLLGQYLKT